MISRANLGGNETGDYPVEESKHLEVGSGRKSARVYQTKTTSCSFSIDGLQLDGNVLTGILHADALMRGHTVYSIFSAICFSHDSTKSGSQLFAKSWRLARSVEEARTSSSGYSFIVDNTSSLTLSDVGLGIQNGEFHGAQHIPTS